MAVVVVLLVLGLVGCGGQAQPTGYRPSAAPVEQTTAAPLKAVAHLTRDTLVPAMSTALTRQKSWRIVSTMWVTTSGVTVFTANGVQTAKPLAMSMDVSGRLIGGKPAKVILVGNALYVSVPGVTPAGKYVKAKGAQAAQLHSMLQGGNPTDLFASLRSVTTVTYDGTRTLGGKKLEAYVATVDTVKALKAIGQTVPAGTPKTIDFEILLDSARLVRELSYTASGLTMKTTITDYNQPVHIAAPPASKVVG
ncbi:hypothetical protein [Kribbella sp. NPDC055071]